MLSKKEHVYWHMYQVLHQIHVLLTIMQLLQEKKYNYNCDKMNGQHKKMSTLIICVHFKNDEIVILPSLC